MSVNYSIGCIDCKEKLWIGQDDYLFSGDIVVMLNFAKFLHHHSTGSRPDDVCEHRLRFNSDIWFDESGEDWKDFKVSYDFK